MQISVLYTGVTKIALNMRSQADKDSASLGTLNENETVQIFGFDQEWLFCWRSDVGTYFIGRHNVDNITPVSDDIAPYGVIRNTYVATTAVDTALYASADENAEKLVSIAADSRLSAWLIQDGWPLCRINVSSAICTSAISNSLNLSRPIPITLRKATLSLFSPRFILCAAPN